MYIFLISFGENVQYFKIYNFTIQEQYKMKGQILSRIQSYQNIPGPINNSMNRLINTQSNKLINQAKVIKYVQNSKDSPIHAISQKQLNSPNKISSRQFLMLGPSFTTNKKLFTTHNANNKEFKRSFNCDLKTADKDKNYRLPKRQSQKCFQFRTLSRDIDKQLQNKNNNQNISNNNLQTINSQRSIDRPRNQTSQLAKDLNRQNFHRRKQIMRVYGKSQISKTVKTFIGSENNIRTLHQKQDQQTRDPEQNNKKPISIMMKTVNVFKDYKNSPYFNFTNKKFSIKSPQKHPPTKSLNRIPTILLTQKDDVSIELSADELPKDLQQQKKQQNMQFGCSEIQQMEMENDSSFLDAANKVMVTEMEQNNRRQESRKRKYKKLPSDFFRT